jgi:hypothetical protein
MGLEEVTSYFHSGLAESARKNPLSEFGSATVAKLSRTTPLDVRYVMAVASIPAGFDHVASIEPHENGALVLRSRSGKTTKAKVDWIFVQ